MATYYVNPVDGLDANNGLGPDASHATNKPWKTTAKVFNTGSTVVPGDTVYFSPGYYYFTSSLVVISGICSSASPSFFRGDPLNVQGFKTAAGVRLAPGIIYFTTRTSLETDGPPAQGGNGVDLAQNGVKGFQGFNLVMEGIGGAAGGLVLNCATNADLLFEDCRFIGTSYGVGGTSGTPTAARNWTFRRCVSVGADYSVNVRPAVAAATANADLNINIEHSLLIGQVSLQLGSGAGNTAGGVHVKGSTFVSPGSSNAAFRQVGAGAHSTVTTSTYEGCLVIASTYMAFSDVVGALVDSGFNRGFCIVNANNNVTEAGTSKRNVPSHVILPDLFKWGLEMPRADIFGWSSDAVAGQTASAWTNTQPDFRGRTARPWKGGASIGYIEANPASKDTGSQITGGGANSLKITGAGEVSLFLPVDAVATTLSVLTESTTYGGTNWPQLIVMANPSIGVTQQTATGTSAAEQTLTAGPFTPTAAGVVEIRLISDSTTVTSATYFDLLQVSV